MSINSVANRAITTLITEIVVAYIGQNKLDAGQIPVLIRSVHDALTQLPSGFKNSNGFKEFGDTHGSPEDISLNIDGYARLPLPDNPAVPIAESVTPDYITCLEDGRRMKTLKRHLRVAHGLTADAYRKRWNLDNDYPVVSSNYSLKRREYANQIGLGSRTRRSKST